MKNKFYVYMSGSGMIVTQIAVALIVLAFAVIGAFTSVEEDGIVGIVVVFCVAAATLVGVLISAFTTRSTDYILLTDDGISYRHLGQEKLFIGYGEAVAVKTKIACRRGRRLDDALVIGVRGSIPDDPKFELRGFKFLDDGWFVCVYNGKLAAALDERLGGIGEISGDESGQTGVPDVKQIQDKTDKKKERPVRRKKDDTHDDEDGGGDTGGWRFD